jgi:hypothetical protein
MLEYNTAIMGSRSFNSPIFTNSGKWNEEVLNEFSKPQKQQEH